MANREVKLYEVPKVLETAKVLDNSVFREYNDSVSCYNNSVARETLNKFNSANGELIGSNIFMLLHLQEEGLLGGSRLATRADLETALRLGLNLAGNYVDFGVALRGENVSYENNRTSATNLVSQLKARGTALGKGKLIPLSALTQKEDASSGYGLTLSLKDDVSQDSLINLGDLKWDYTTKEGIARAFLGGGGGWCFYYDSLAYSDGDGRVVVVSAEGTAQNFLAQLDAETRKAKEGYLASLEKQAQFIKSEQARLK